MGKQPFSDYQAFNQEVLRIQQKVLGQYPTLNVVFDILFRYRLKRIGHGYRRPFKRELSDPVGWHLFSLNIRVYYFRLLLNITNKLRANKLVGLVYCPRAPLISDSFLLYLKSDPKYFSNTIHLGILHKYLLNKTKLLLLRTPGFKDLMQDDDPLSFIKHIHLEALEFQIESHVNQISGDLKKYGAQLFMSQDFHSLIGRLLCIASARAKVITVEVAHGYTQDQTLLTVAPFVSNYSILWSDRLVENVKKVLPANYHSRLHSFGPPLKTLSSKKSTISHSKEKSLNCLVVLPPLGHLDKINQAIEIRRATKIIMIIRKHFTNIVVRLKSTDTAREKYLTEKIILKSKFSKNSLYKDIKWADYVIGPSSSVLLEAVISRKNAIEITRELGASTLIEGTICCSLEDLEERLRDLLNNPTKSKYFENSLSFRQESFLKFLDFISIIDTPVSH